MDLISRFQSAFSPSRTSSYKAARLGANHAGHDNRLQQYNRLLRAYQGYSIRGLLNTATVTQQRRVKFNFVQPVVNLSAGWFAAKPLTWMVDNDPEATKECHAIWDRSGSDRALLENAICCGIYGDLVGIATSGKDNRRPHIEFVEPSIATPTFDGSDYSKLVSLELAHEALDEFGRPVVRREFFGPNVREVYVGDAQVSEETVNYDHIPVTWIRNSSIKGIPYGLSDVEPILELVEEYDHVATKQTRIVDTYASPSIVFKGIQESDLNKNMRTMFFLPPEGDAYFLEWSGTGPDTEKQLTRMRNAIAEISQVPAVAFGQADSGLTSISGVAIQILYGPLLNKTHRKQANWGPALEYLMWRCLVAAGFVNLELEQVNAQFPSATPVDGQALVAEASAKVAAGISSRRRVMSDIGIENPSSELKQIVTETLLLGIAEPPAALAQDAATAAKAGSKGAFAAQVPAGVGANKPVMSEPMTPETLAAALARFDALIETEGASIKAAEDGPVTH